MTVTPRDVLKFTKPTDGFLCPLSANKYDIDFLSFSIRNYETKSTIFRIGQQQHDGNDDDDNAGTMEVDVDETLDGEDSFRKIKYTFGDDVLRSPSIATSLTFRVGPNPLPSFRMIERHYFKNHLVKSYDFTFGFCIPGSTNTWDAVYDVPPLGARLGDDMVRHPFLTRSDSFYFVGDELVMHNKASYRYLAKTVGEESDGKMDGVGMGLLEGDLKKRCVVGESKGFSSSRGGSSLLPRCEAKGGDDCRVGSERKGGSTARWSKEADY